jgi:hypothetical protein
LKNKLEQTAKGELSKKDMTFHTEGKKYKILLLLNTISLKNPQYQGTKSPYMSFDMNAFVLIRRK